MGSFNDVSAVTVDVSCNDNYYYRDTPMLSSGGVWQVSLADLPVGQNLLFRTHALNEAGAEIFTGSRIYALGSGSETLTITMIPYTENAYLPRISKITRLAQVSLGSSGPVKLWVEGRTGETLNYMVNTSESGFGSLTPASGSITLRGADDIISLDYLPRAVGTDLCSVVVTNSQGNSLRTSFTIEVVDSTGTLGVSLLFPPVIMALDGIQAADKVTFRAEVYDDGDLEEVTYAWSFDGSGDAFIDPAINPAVLTGYTPDLAGTLMLTVTDQEGDGISSTLTYQLEAGALVTLVAEPSLVLTPHQNIPTIGAHDWEFFTIGSESYLAVANYHNDSSYDVDSKIYHWNGTAFEEFQILPTQGARDWEAYTIASANYLMVSNCYINSAASSLSQPFNKI